jgi:hypothetical protein
LRWCWSLSGREGLWSSLPPAELARRDSGVFELKRLFSTTPKVEKEMEANGGHRSDRTLDRTRSLFDRTRPVSVQRLRVFQFVDRTRSTSGHSRSDASSRSGSLLDSNRTLALWRPISSAARPVDVSSEHGSGLTSVSSPLQDQRARSYFACSVRATSASGRCFASVDTVRSARPVSLTSASGQRDFDCFKFLMAIFEGVRL